MRKILTVVLDGFGYREEEYGNAIKMADTKNFDKIWENYPHTTLHASEEYVGLNEGEFGNSEIGHMTIGAGRKIKQHGPRITEFFKNLPEDNKEFNEFLESAKNKTVHIIGLFSDGKVHSNLEHFLSMYDVLKEHETKKINFHLITDGRDTKTNASINFINELEEKIKDDEQASITSICGRYYAMDRDTNYDRTKIYYDLLTRGIGIKAKTATDGILSLYKKNQTDEFLYPLIIKPENTIKDGDIIVWMNYRSDRAKQILRAFTSESFDGFRTYKYKNLPIYTFFQADKNINTINFLEDINVTNPLGLYLSSLGITQSRIAETEKYAHVTYFFDGMYNGKIEKCDKVLVPSPKVDTYNLKPEMSATEVTKKAISAMEKDIDFIFVNFANPDMVGHTGDLDATMKAVTTVDICLERLYEVAKDNFYTMFILADHGNADIMLDEFNNPVTTHTTSKVPFIITDTNVELKKSGDLTQVAPTILEYMDIALPEEMADTNSLFIN
ncbi:MAG: 2,3-bisphosphoglycerate-independent phosphoglycerate mutase [Firmicutes bacterium]|nr:2,3-bisphosphoglycerate-independent phosphoglycerate mutase [Bacillota bacterium]